MRDAMQVGDGVLFYHSSCAEPGIVGIAEVASAAYPDPTQFEPSSPYYDPASKMDAPRWLRWMCACCAKRNPDLACVARRSELTDLLVLKKGTAYPLPRWNRNTGRLFCAAWRSRWLGTSGDALYRPMHMLVGDFFWRWRRAPPTP